MSIDWRGFSRKAGFKAEDHTILVELAEGRCQKVYIEDAAHDGYLLLWSVAAGSSALSEASEKAEFLAWRRNHLSDLVGFKIDRKGRLIGEAWAPTAGLDAQEWAIHLMALARSCDRMEYLLTGKDQQ